MTPEQALFIYPDKESAAYHAAGHAVVAWDQGGTVLSACLRSQVADGGLGESEWAGSVIYLPRPGTQDAVGVSGLVANQLLTFGDDEDLVPDMEELPIIDRMQPTFDSVSDGDIDLACRVLAKHWGLVASVARHLVDREVLTGEDLRHFLV